MKYLLLLALTACLHLSYGQTAEEYLDLGFDKYADENYEGAIEDFNKALVLNPKSAEAFYLRGVCLSALGRKKEAMNDLNKATDLIPKYAEAYYEKGYIYLTDQNAEQAIKEFDKAISMQPDFAEAYVSRGTAKCMLEDKAGALADWKTAKDLGVGYTEYMLCE